MSLLKIWRIAKREFLTNFRRRSFLFTAFFVPLITVGAMYIVFNVISRIENDVSSYEQIAVIDNAGIFDVGATLPPPFSLSTEQIAQDALEGGNIQGYYVIPENYIRTGVIDAYARPDLPLNDTLAENLDDTIKEALAAQLGDPRLAERLRDPLEELEIYREGSTQRLEESALIATVLVPLILAMIMFIVPMTASQFLMSSLVEEKENRMMELFITSSRPVEMLWGKLLGLGSLGLTMFLIWGGLGLAYAASQGTVDIAATLASLQITPDLAVILVAYFLIGFLLYGAIMAGIGASVNAEQEGRQTAGLISLLAISPIFFIVSFISEPNGLLARFLSTFPFTSPVGMIMRYMWAGVTPGELLLSIGIGFVSVLVAVWLAARIFRLGMLNYGKRLGVRDIFRALREGRQQVISAREAA
jgi:ABC-2 type transport system permease protein